MLSRIVLLVALLLSVSSLPARAERAPFDPGRAGFGVAVRDDVNPYRVLGLFVLPGEQVPLAVQGAAAEGARIEHAVGTSRATGPGQWLWEAPQEHGFYSLRVLTASGKAMQFNVFVMVPAKQVKNGMLNGYRIGSYPRTPFRGLDIYRPPQGYIELQPGDEDILVAPHFTLGQFLCKQTGGYPKYLVLREKLMLKLESILEHVNAAGHRADSLYVMSGYRTPAYNKALGNTANSRHLWGGAADIFVDENPKDGIMDDLNGDGRIDRGDGNWLYDLIEILYERPAFLPFAGGLGRYGSTPAHGPFVHVDVRGTPARWGKP